jgi:hypothetical protein
VGCPSGAGDSEPLGTTGCADTVGLAGTVGAPVAVGGLSVGVSEMSGIAVASTAGVEPVQAPARTRERALTATRARLTLRRLRPPLE